jgi:hypothetical protein
MPVSVFFNLKYKSSTCEPKCIHKPLHESGCQECLFHQCAVIFLPRKQFCSVHCQLTLSCVQRCQHSYQHRVEHLIATRAWLICCSVVKNQQIDVLIKDDQESCMELAVHFGIGHSAMQEIIFAVRCWKVYCCQISQLARMPRRSCSLWDAGKLVIVRFPTC